MPWILGGEHPNQEDPPKLKDSCLSKLRDPTYYITYLNCNLIIIVYLNYSTTNDMYWYVLTTYYIYIYFELIIYIYTLHTQMTVTTSKWKVYPEMPAAGGWWDQRADGCGYGHNLAYHTTVSWIRPSPVFFLVGLLGWVGRLGPTHRMVWWVG